MFQYPLSLEVAVLEVIDRKRFTKNKSPGLECVFDFVKDPTVQEIETENQVERVFFKFPLIQVDDLGFKLSLFLIRQGMGFIESGF